MKMHYFHFWSLVTFVSLASSSFFQSCGDLEEGQCQMNIGHRSLACYAYGSRFGRNDMIRSLTLCAHPSSHLDVTHVLESFPSLEYFTVTDSNVSRIRGMFPRNSRLKTLNFTGIGLEKLRSHAMLALEGLRVLDLRNNRLNHVHPAFVTLANRLETIYLDGNEWNCAKNLDWVLYVNATVVQDLQNLTCFGAPYQDKPLRAIATFISNMRGECPEPCECAMLNVVRLPDDRGGGLMPMIQVNCSSRGFINFPEMLPVNTTTVLLKRNRITSVSALIRNRIYRGVADIFLDDNLITSVDELEGTHWLQHFRVFSLRGNLLSQIPTYAWDNALKRNQNAVQLFLGLNPWRCDCFFTPGFQELLLKYEIIIQDAEDIKCAKADGDENSLKTIIDLSRVSVCSLPSEYSIHALDLLNIILATLIILILAKLAYDYYQFKKTGQLPWIVTKIP